MACLHEAFVFLALASACLSAISAEEDIKIETIKTPEECNQTTKDNDFLTLHFKSIWEDGEVITST